MLNRAYGWDTTDNITAITNLVDPSRSQMFGYDGLYRLTFAQGIYGSHSYQYDALGNRTALNTDTASTSYAYAAASNRLTAVDEGTGAVPIAYDPAGNTLDDGERTFTYNARNRLSEADGHQYGYNAHNLRVFKPRFGFAGDASGDGLVTEADLTLLQQALNGQGTATLAMDCNQDGVVDNRDTPCIARQIGANRNQGRGQGNGGGNGGPPPAPTSEPVQVGWVLFTHDEQGRLIGEYDEQGNPLRRYIWLNDLPVALIDTNGIHYIHSDHLNTPQAVTDSSGTLVWAADYAPFGEVTETIATLELNLRFPGQYLDRETGLHQNWHREYDPMTGRYTQSDPIGLGGGMNTFRYAVTNPVIASDNLGLDSTPDSPSPTRAMGFRFPITAAICAVARTWDSERQRQLEIVDEIYRDNITLIQRGCDRTYYGCDTIEAPARRIACIENCISNCQALEREQFERYRAMQEDVMRRMRPSAIAALCEGLRL